MIRRIALAGAVLLLARLISPLGAAADSLLVVDHEKLVSRADLTYDRPATRSEEGMPVGNGRMGSLLWTTPSACCATRSSTLPRATTSWRASTR